MRLRPRGNTGDKEPFLLQPAARRANAGLPPGCPVLRESAGRPGAAAADRGSASGWEHANRRECRPGRWPSQPGVSWDPGRGKVASQLASPATQVPCDVGAGRLTCLSFTFLICALG